MDLSAVLAAAETTPPDIGTWIAKYAVQFGMFGLVFFDVFVTRKFFIPKWSKDEAITGKDELIALRDEVIAEKNADIAELKTSLAKLQDITRDQILPALVRSNQLSADYVQEITHRAYPGPPPERPVTRRARGNTE